MNHSRANILTVLTVEKQYNYIIQYENEPCDEISYHYPYSSQRFLAAVTTNRKIPDSVVRPLLYPCDFGYLGCKE